MPPATARKPRKPATKQEWTAVESAAAKVVVQYRTYAKGQAAAAAMVDWRVKGLAHIGGGLNTRAIKYATLAEAKDKALAAAAVLVERLRLAQRTDEQLYAISEVERELDKARERLGAEIGGPNEHGVLDQHETVNVPLPKTHLRRCQIYVAEHAGRWHWGFCWDFMRGELGGSSHAPSEKWQQHAGTRDEAIAAAAEWILARWKERLPKETGKNKTALAAAVKGLESWLAERVADEVVPAQPAGEVDWFFLCPECGEPVFSSQDQRGEQVLHEACSQMVDVPELFDPSCLEDEAMKIAIQGSLDPKIVKEFRDEAGSNIDVSGWDRNLLSAYVDEERKIVRWPIDKIGLDPGNRDIQPAKVAELAERFKSGAKQLQPVLLRIAPAYWYRVSRQIVETPDGEACNGLPEGYPLCIDGESRLKAMHRAGWEECDAILYCDVSDRLAAEIQIAANVDRNEYTPIQRAEQMQRMKDQFGATNESIAKRFRLPGGKGSVSNELKLLKLPKYWRDKVELPEDDPLRLPTSFARLLVPYVQEAPEFDKIVRKDFETKPNSDGWQDVWGSRVNLQHGLDFLVKRKTRSLDTKGFEYFSSFDLTGKFQDGLSGEYPRCAFDFEPHKEKLKIESLPGEKGIEPRATDVKLFDRLQKAACKKIAKKRSESHKSQRKSGGEPKKRTAAEQKKLRAQQDQSLKTKQRELTFRWLRFECAAVLGFTAGLKYDHVVLKVANYMALHGRTLHYSSSPETLESVSLRACRMYAQQKRVAKKGQHWREVSLVPLDQQKTLQSTLVTRWLWPIDEEWKTVGEPAGDVPNELVEGLAADLEIDLDAAWKDAQSGPVDLTEDPQRFIRREFMQDFFELCNSRQLVALCKQMGYTPEASGKGKLVAELMATKKTLKRPAALKPV